MMTMISMARRISCMYAADDAHNDEDDKLLAKTMINIMMTRSMRS